jgi:hypothetical protein
MPVEQNGVLPDIETKSEALEKVINEPNKKINTAPTSFRLAHQMNSELCVESPQRTKLELGVVGRNMGYRKFRENFKRQVCLSLSEVKSRWFYVFSVQSFGIRHMPLPTKLL